MLDPNLLLTDLKTMTYAEVADRHGCSRGKVYAAALAAGARKHENRIREKATARAQRRLDT